MLFMILFAFVPAIDRDAADLEAIGLGGMLLAGAYFGAYYSARRTTRKARRGGVAIPVVVVVAIICASLFAQNPSGEQSDDEMVPYPLAAAGKVVVGVLGAVLGANLGGWYRAGTKLYRRVLIKERVLLTVIFVGALAVAYAECAEAGQSRGGSVNLQYAAPFIAVASVFLGASYGSYKVWLGGHPAFGLAVAVLLIFAVMLYVWLLTGGRACTDVVIWPFAFATLVVALEMLGAQLGAHYSAYLKG